mmetsp:Transcript_39711/g.39302  ORF Transcript_39711/g.39302 Transcript_39711/m.39302 type:complete len:195 (-) Transcript_39711:85-669(-)
MENEAEKIRNSSSLENSKLIVEARKTPKRKNTDKLKHLNSIGSAYKTKPNELEAVSLDPDEVVRASRVLKKMHSFKANKRHSITYSDNSDPVLSSLIGYIDSMGVFKLNIDEDDLSLLSLEVIENIGFFNKLSYESNLKNWHKDMKYAFKMHKNTLRDVIFSERTKMKPLVSFILNWEYFERLSCYLVDNKDLT